MIRDTVLSIEKHFSDNWGGEVNYNQPNYIAKASRWIELIVVPLLSQNSSIDNCTVESYDIQVLAYGTNKVNAGEEIDLAIAFLQNMKIDGVRIKGWRQIANGLLDTGTYFYKISFDAQA